MRGPLRLDPAEIDRAVPARNPGNYALGYIKDTVPRSFVARFVGRADTDLNKVLKEQAADDSSWFKWRIARSSREAWEVECRNFHDFWETGQLENDEHPEPPKGSGWTCPVCE
jgi:hypothetical protein